MTSVATFVRRVPTDILQSYFDKSDLALSANAGWRALKEALDKLDEANRPRILNEIERIGEMSDEPGQTALLGVLFENAPIKVLPNGYGRAAWAFVHEPESFRRAEEARYADERRRGRMWSGYQGQPEHSVLRSDKALDRFKSAVRELYASQNVHIDLFDREKSNFKGEHFRIIQATIYREGVPDDVAQFEDGQLAWRSRRPVYEAAVTYESESGSVEVVSNNRQCHASLARTFAQELLGAASGQEQLPLREYDLDLLLRSHSFPTDAEDGIESVKVTELRLMPVNSEGERLTIECSRHTEQTIWDMASFHLGLGNPLLGGWVPTKAKLVIRFHPDPDCRRGKILPVTVTMPHGCDLKDRTTRESMIGQKYLQRWRLVRNV